MLFSGEEREPHGDGCGVVKIMAYRPPYNTHAAAGKVFHVWYEETWTYGLPREFRKTWAGQTITDVRDASVYAHALAEHFGASVVVVDADGAEGDGADGRGRSDV